MMKNEHFTIASIALSALFIQFICNMLVVLVNPGIPNRTPLNVCYPEKVIKNTMSSLLYCRVCKIVKNPNTQTYHCSTCDLCVEGFDHHCPWVGKCIGKGNLYYFYAYIATTLGMLIYLVISAAIIKHS